MITIVNNRKKIKQNVLTLLKTPCGFFYGKVADKISVKDYILKLGTKLLMLNILVIPGEIKTLMCMITNQLMLKSSLKAIYKKENKMEIVYEKRDKPKTIRGYEIPVGTYFTGSIDGNDGLFVRSFGSIVSLDNPKKDYDAYPSDSPIVDNYLPVEIKIIVKNKE